MKLYTILLSMLLLCASLAFSQEAATTVIQDLEPEEKDFLNAVEAHKGRVLFTVDDIVRYDWNRQILELTPSAAAIFSTIATEDITHYAFKDKDGVIYRGRIRYTPMTEEEVYDGAVMINDKSGSGKYPALPYLTIVGGYGVKQEEATKGDQHLDRRVKNVLEEYGLLDEIRDTELPLEAVYSKNVFLDQIRHGDTQEGTAHY